MSLGHYLFSFGGRINRAKQWGIVLIGLVGAALQFALVRATVGTGTLIDVVSRKITLDAFLASTNTRMFLAIWGVLFIVLLYIRLAVDTKRLHDRNKSAWWLLVFVVAPLALNIPSLLQASASLSHVADVIRAAQQGLPRPPHIPSVTPNPIATLMGGAAGILSLWAFVKLYCLRGTTGGNRFGSDPLAPKG